MIWWIAVLGFAVLATTLWDSFATVVIPKTIERRISFSGLFYNVSWNVWQVVAKTLKDGPLRLALLSAYAPITLLLLFMLWAAAMIFGFTLIHFGLHSLPAGTGFETYLYFSGETFFTLGYGDMTPKSALNQWISVFEAGTGFMFLALMIGYIPVLYGHFSSREQLIVRLDSRAGSMPSAGEVLRRYAASGAMESLPDLLKEWEDWSSKQLEAYLSYPILAFYRSQHDHQSWLCSLTAILDTCTLIELGFDTQEEWYSKLRFQARATFAMGRHVIVDLAYLLNAAPDFKSPSRLPESSDTELRSMLENAGLKLRKDRQTVFEQRLRLYEPYCVSIARDCFYTLPGWVPEPGAIDNWEFSAWEKSGHFMAE